MSTYFRTTQNFILVRNKENLGYTKSANIGLKYSSAPYVFLLNSDAIISKGVITKIIEKGEQHKKVGIIGPLSNAASWQTTPNLFDENGKFYVNQIPKGFSQEEINQLCENIYEEELPIVPLVNGFCYAIKRELIETIGYLDEINFPVVYGEEDDFSIRAFEAGSFSTIALDTYVFHAKSKSFTPEGRKPLAAKGRKKLIEKHGEEFLNALVEVMKDQPDLHNQRRKLLPWLNKG